MSVNKDKMGASMASSKRICVVGGGHWGQNHIKTLYEMGSLGAIVESNPERLAELLTHYSDIKGYLALEDSLKDAYDGYVLATPAETHFNLGYLLLNEKKNVLIEKPLTLSTKEARKLIRLSEKNDCRLMVGHLLLFHPAITKIKELLDLGKIGKVLYVYSSRLNFGIVRTHENVFSSFASHDISVLNYLIGQSPTAINADGSCLLQEHIQDVVIASLDYPGNIKAHIFVSWLFPYKEQKLIIVGDSGMLSFEDASIDKKIYFYNKRIEFQEGLPIKKEEASETIEYTQTAPLKNELAYFMGCLDSDITKNDGKSGYEVVKVIEKVEKKLNKRYGKEKS